MLANLETDSEKLLQVILIGQPRLEKTLREEGLSQLEQRILFGVHLDNLSLSETKEYIRYRLRAGGAIHDGIFTEDAMEVIHAESSGIPRMINNLCDTCLVNAYATGKEHIDSVLAREAIEERTRLFTSNAGITPGGLLTGERKVTGLIPRSIEKTCRESIKKTDKPGQPGTRNSSPGSERRCRDASAVALSPPLEVKVGRVLRVRSVLDPKRRSLLIRQCPSTSEVGKRADRPGILQFSGFGIGSTKKRVLPKPKSKLTGSQRLELIESKFIDLMKKHPDALLKDYDAGDALFAGNGGHSSNGGEQ